MRLTGVLHKAATDMLELIGPLTKKWSNLPDSYIKRASEQVYYRTPRGLPNYLNRVIARRRYRFTTNRPWTQQFQQQNQNGTHFKRILIEPIRDWSFFKGDRVEVMVGRDKGKQGIVSQVIQERNWVIVEGLNTHYRRMGKEKDFPGVIVLSEAPLLVTGQVKLVDPETLKWTDIEWRYTEDGNKVRVSTSTSRIIPIPSQAEETKDYKTKSAYIDNETKDTISKEVEKITFEPALKTFEMDIMEQMGIKEDRVPVPSYWY